MRSRCGLAMAIVAVVLVGCGGEPAMEQRPSQEGPPAGDAANLNLAEQGRLVEVRRDAITVDLFDPEPRREPIVAGRETFELDEDVEFGILAIANEVERQGRVFQEFEAQPANFDVLKAGDEVILSRRDDGSLRRVTVSPPTRRNATPATALNRGFIE